MREGQDTIAGAAYPTGRAVDVDTFDLSFTAAKNTPMVKFRVKEWQGKDTPAKWHTVLVFGQQAERVADSLRAGDQVIVVGQWKPNEWTKRDGTTVHDRTMFADEVAVGLRWSAVDVIRVERGPSGAPTVPAPAKKQYPDEAPF